MHLEAVALSLFLSSGPSTWTLPQEWAQCPVWPGGYAFAFHRMLRSNSKSQFRFALVAVRYVGQFMAPPLAQQQKLTSATLPKSRTTSALQSTTSFCTSKRNCLRVSAVLWIPLRLKVSSASRRSESAYDAESTLVMRLDRALGRWTGGDRDEPAGDEVPVEE